MIHRNCRTYHHKACKGCDCFCHWPSSIVEPRLLVACWCERHFFNLPREMVRRGETVSCGDECQKVSA